MKQIKKCLQMKPIIGILAQPRFSEKTDEHQRSFLPASYVEWIRNSGGEVVAIPFDCKEETMAMLLENLHGVCFPGGSLTLHNEKEYMETSRRFFEMSIFRSQQKTDWFTILYFILYCFFDRFPLLSICQGFQQLLQLVDADFNLEKVHATNHWTQMKLNDQGEEFIGSVFENSDDSEMLTKWVKQGKNVSVFHNNQHGIKLETWTANKKLGAFYDVFSRSVDKDGVEFVNIIKAKESPVRFLFSFTNQIYGFQFHPEKVSFEDRVYDVLLDERVPIMFPKTSVGVKQGRHILEVINKRLADFFVNTCSIRSDYHERRRVLEPYLIDNWKKKIIKMKHSTFKKMFYFPKQ